jgi:predicted glycosyltransferase
MLRVFNKYFDRLLVHGDPHLIPLERTFLYADRISGRLEYTGYVVERTGMQSPASGTNTATGTGEVLVSAGGGAVGRSLLETAIRARPLTGLAHRTWRVLAGVNASAADIEALHGLAGEAGAGHVVVERSRSDFPRMLDNCELSVSQGGYNTIMEILQAGTRSVVVPYAGGSETEQSLRAGLLAERGLIEVVAESALSPDVLAAAVDRAAKRPRPMGGDIDLGGAQRSAELVARWASESSW